MNFSKNLKQAHRRVFVLGVSILALSLSYISVPAQAQEKVKFFSFDFTEIKFFHGYPGPSPIKGQPITSPHTVAAKLSGPSDEAEFRLVNEDGDTLETIGLIGSGTRQGHFIGTIDVPDEPFQVAVSGVDLHGRSFDLIFPKVFRRQSLEVSLEKPQNQIKHGQTGTFIATVINHGEANTVRMEATAQSGSLIKTLDFAPVSRVAPATLSLGEDETGTFEIDITIPLETTGADSIILTTTAISTTEPEIQNFSKRRISFAKPSSYSLLPEIHKAEIKVHPEKGGFEIQGRLVLDPESDGINPVTDEIKVYVRIRSKGPEETLPAGSFVEKRKKFVYQQKGNSGIREMVLKKNGHFEITGKKLDTSMMDITKPLSLYLVIGNDRGTKVVQLKKKGKNKGVFRLRKDKVDFSPHGITFLLKMEHEYEDINRI